MKTEQIQCNMLNGSILDIATAFRDKYFTYEDGSKADIDEIDWREDELSYNFQFGDCFFSLQDIYYAMWYDIHEDILFKWYDEAVEEKTSMNLKNYYLANKKK